MGFLSKTEWKKIGGWTAVSIFIGAGVLAYYGGREAFRYYDKYQLDKTKKKVLEDVKASIESSSAVTKKTLAEGEVEKLLLEWKEDMDKLSPKALQAFVEFFNVTVPIGKCAEKDKEFCPLNSWIYSVNNSDDFEKKKEALNEFITSEMKDDKLIEYYDNTRLTEKFAEFDNKLKIG